MSVHAVPNNRSLVVRAFAVIAIAVIATLWGPPQDAHAAGATVYNNGSRLIHLCHNAASTTACAGPTGSIKPGENSRTRFGWQDTDMIWIHARCTLDKWGYFSGQQRWYRYAMSGSSGRWMKIGDMSGGTFRILC